MVSVFARVAAPHPLAARLPFARLLGVGALADVLAVGALVVLAGAVRWPHLLLSPQFPSVGDTILMALDMAEGRAFYLHDSAPYLGAPFLWLLALVYRVFGPSLEATMILVWLLGSLTVVPTYLLGREVGGRGGGTIAAAFLATSGAHTVVSSHVALSHSLTPLVTTTALWLLARAVSRAGTHPPALTLARSRGADAPLLALGRGETERGPETRGREAGRLLALGGLLAGLALQTHPTSTPLLVGGAVGALVARPGWLRTRWPAVAVAMVLLGYSTLLAHHVISRFEVVADIQSKQERYLDDDEDAGEAAGHGVYLNNLEQLGLATTRLLGGALDERERPASYLRDPWIVATVALTVAGVVLAARRRHWWLVGAVTLAAVLPPVFSGKYRPVLDGRYLMPLVPVLFVALGLAASTIARAVAGATREARPVALAPRLARGAAMLVLAGGLALLAAHPLLLLDAYYEDSQEDGFSNALYLRTVAQVQAARQAGEPVLLDPLLASVKSTGGGKASTSFAFLLALAHVPHEQLDLTEQAADLGGRLAILHRSTADRLDDTLRLDPLDGRRQNGKERPSYRAYRIGTVSAVQP